jgi:hypothetical protein
LFSVSIDSDDTSEDEELNRPLATMLLCSQNNKNTGKHEKLTINDGTQYSRP